MINTYLESDLHYRTVILIHFLNSTFFQIKRYCNWKFNIPNYYYSTILTDKCNLTIQHINVACIKPSIVIKKYPSIK